MSSGDLWFLLIFIILPTAILVSGFWAFLFVRRDPRKTIPQRRQRAAESKSTRDDIEETVQVETVPPVRAEREPAASDSVAEEAREMGPAAPVVGPTASELADDMDDDAGAIEDQPEGIEAVPEAELEMPGPSPAELPADEAISQPSEPAAQAVDDERLIELIDVDDRDDLMAEIQRRREAQPARLESSTDEIPDLGEALIEPARLSEAGGHEEWRPRDTAEQAGAEAEPTEWEISENELAGDVDAPQSDAGDDDEEPAERDEDSGSGSENQRRYRRRRPRVKLLPSDNNERQERRGRLAGRRKQDEERPSRRDKGGM